MVRNEPRQAVILAGGKGTRLSSRLAGNPKPLVRIGDTPLLSHQLRLLEKHGFKNVILLVNHGAEQIRDYCRERKNSDVSLMIVDDGTPRGTAGAVLQVIPQLEEQFLVLYGDTMLNVDLGRFWEQHTGDGEAAASLFLHPNSHPHDSDLVELDEQNRIVRFHSYPHLQDAYLPNLVNAALYSVQRQALEDRSSGALPVDFAKDLFPSMLGDGLLLRGYVSPEYIRDIGTPDRLDQVSRDFSLGVIERASLRTPQRAIFIDRDGTLNEERGHIASPQDLRVFDFAGPAIRRLNGAEWRTVIITNQPVVARGEATLEELRQIHNKLDTEMGRHHAYFDRTYICPHHPDRGFVGEIPELKITCDCRKPAAGLIYKAKQDLNINLVESWFIGDSSADMTAAATADVTSVLVETGQSGRDERYPCRPDVVVTDIAAAVEFILDVYPKLVTVCEPILAFVEAGSDWFIGGDPTLRRKYCAAVGRELRRQGKSCRVLHLDPWPEQDAGSQKVYECSDVSDLKLAYLRLQTRRNRPVELNELELVKNPLFHAETVIFWEGALALRLACEIGLPHQSIYLQDGSLTRAECPPPSSSHIVNLRHVFLSKFNVMPETLT